MCSGVRGGAAQPPDLLDARDPGQEEVAQVAPRHHRYEQDEAAQPHLRRQMTVSRAGQAS